MPPSTNRPSRRPAYSARLLIQLTPQMRDAIRDAADAEEMTTSEWVRRAIRAALPPSTRK